MEKMTVEKVGNDSRYAAAEYTERQDSRPVQNSDVVQAVRKINPSELFGDQSELTFVIDRRTQTAMVRIVNKESGEVVRQLPPEYVLAVQEELERLMEGGDSAELKWGRD